MSGVGWGVMEWGGVGGVGGVGWGGAETVGLGGVEWGWVGWGGVLNTEHTDQFGFDINQVVRATQTSRRMQNNPHIDQPVSHSHSPSS